MIIDQQMLMLILNIGNLEYSESVETEAALY
jgi:hypothetical protein